MEPRAHHVLIGLFTLLACSAIVLFALWLNQAHKQGQIAYYRVIFYEPVRGLSKGSSVLYNGIRIGEVTDLHLDSSDLREAHARLAIDANIPIHVDTKAQLVLTGITGASAIEFSGGSPKSPLVKAVDGREPVIIATPSPLSQLMEGGDSLITNISELALSAKMLFSPENAEHITEILNNINVLTTAVSNESEDIASLISDVAAASRQLRETFAKAESLVESGTKLLTEQGQKTLQLVQGTMSAFEEAGQRLADVIAESSSSVKSGARGLESIGPVLQDLRRTLYEVQEVVRKFDDNPSSYLFGSDAINEFKP